MPTSSAGRMPTFALGVCRLSSVVGGEKLFVRTVETNAHRHPSSTARALWLPREDRKTMASTNVIQFAPALRRWREHHGDRVIRGSSPWDADYPAGIDGLWSEPRTVGKVIPFPGS
jgi:hypothetical protein